MKGFGAGIYTLYIFLWHYGMHLAVENNRIEPFRLSFLHRKQFVIYYLCLATDLEYHVFI